MLGLGLKKNSNISIELKPMPKPKLNGVELWLMDSSVKSFLCVAKSIGEVVLVISIGPKAHGFGGRIRYLNGLLFWWLLSFCFLHFGVVLSDINTYLL